MLLLVFVVGIGTAPRCPGSWPETPVIFGVVLVVPHCSAARSAGRRGAGARGVARKAWLAKGAARSAALVAKELKWRMPLDERSGFTGRSVSTEQG